MLSLIKALNDMAGAFKNGIVSEKLLWTNSSPTSAFASQTISLNLSAYDSIKLIWKRAYNQGYYYTDYFQKGLTCQIARSMPNASNSTSTENGTVWVANRLVTVNKSGVTFGVGRYMYTDRTSSNNIYSNAHVIPYKIYGIKTLGGA